MARTWRRVGLGVLCLLAVLGLAGSTTPAAADQAPFWESPVGLVPGNPDIQVRMAAETVDVEVVERGDEIHAVVAGLVHDGERRPGRLAEGRVPGDHDLAVRSARGARL